MSAPLPVVETDVVLLQSTQLEGCRVNRWVDAGLHCGLVVGIESARWPDRRANDLYETLGFTEVIDNVRWDAPAG